MADKKKIKKALITSRTKGYYRFSKTFPATTDSDGFRDNESHKKQRFTLKEKGLVFVLLLFVFSLTYITTDVLMDLSSRPPIEANFTDPIFQEQDPLEQSVRAVYASTDILNGGQPLENFIENAKTVGINAVMVDFKTMNGFLSYESDLELTNTLYASRNAYANLPEVLDRLEKEGIEVIARMYCFVDNLGALSLQGAAVYDIKPDMTQEVWRDDSLHNGAWLNPYSQKAVQYLTDIAKEISQLKVSYILLDGVSFPDSYQQSNLVFEGEETSSLSRNRVLIDFIAKVKNEVEDAKILTSMTADSALNGDELLYDGSLFTNATDFAAVDLRLSALPDNIKAGDRVFPSAKATPYVFITVVSRILLERANEIDENLGLFPIIEADSSSAQQINALNTEGIYNYILFKEENSYSEKINVYSKDELIFEFD